MVIYDLISGKKLMGKAALSYRKCSQGLKKTFINNTSAVSVHTVKVNIQKVAKYARGRPAKGKPRVPLRHEYVRAAKFPRPLKK